jgi:hypothetical protein
LQALISDFFIREAVVNMPCAGLAHNDVRHTIRFQFMRVVRCADDELGLNPSLLFLLFQRAVVTLQLNDIRPGHREFRPLQKERQPRLRALFARKRQTYLRQSARCSLALPFSLSLCGESSFHALFL